VSHDPGPTDAVRRAADFWNERHRTPEAEAHDNFLSHPLIQAYISLRAFGSLVGHLDVVAAEVASRTPRGGRVLSVGCGRAPKEIALAKKLPDRDFVGVDIAGDIVAAARELVGREGLTNLSLEIGDFNALGFESGSFDAVLGLGAIHHVENLEGFWESCSRFLRPGGVVLAQEYVGASRFQWTDAQIEHGSRVLRTLVPEVHRRHHSSVTRPAVEVLVALDPSEAVRSAEILPSCRAAGFHIDGYASAGCALLQPVLMYQVASFDPADWEHNLVLARLFAEEARLMQAGALGDDFAMFVARPPR
jgi:SAM-dependent methyltransferase